MRPAIRVTGLAKRYGKLTALSDVDVDIPAGSVTALVGPNAAGKTTLVKAILGLVHPDAGLIQLAGRPVGSDPSYRERIGYMPQHPSFPENLRVRELLRFVDELRRVPAESSESDFDPVRGRALVDEFELGPALDRRLGTLSGGTRQRVNAALAFRYAPDVLILDEPTAGLDPLSRTRLKAVIDRSRKGGASVLVTSHVLSELRDLAEYVVYLVEGRVAFSGSVPGLLESTGGADLEDAVARLMAGQGGNDTRREAQ